MKVKLEYQFFTGCPNQDKMRSNLTEAIKGLEDKIELNEIFVEDQETAKRVGFLGSPTLLINGKDLEGLTPSENPSLSCRFYPKGIPEPSEIRKQIIKEFNTE